MRGKLNDDRLDIGDEGRKYRTRLAVYKGNNLETSGPRDRGVSHSWRLCQQKNVLDRTDGLPDSEGVRVTVPGRVNTAVCRAYSYTRRGIPAVLSSPLMRVNGAWQGNQSLHCNGLRPLPI